MKLFSAIIALSTGVALAEQPFLVKSNYMGEISPEHYVSEVCALYSNRIVITRTMGDNELVLTEERPVTLSPSIVDTLALAATESVTTTENLMCDGPETVTTGHHPEMQMVITLYSTGGCGTPKQERWGAASRALRSLINAHCPETH